jgi:hypothetical protein
MTRETKDELLLTILLFGFRRLSGSLESFPLTIAKAALPSPNTGVCRPSNGEAAKPFALCDPVSLAWLCDSWGDSCMLGGTCERVLLRVPKR